MHCIDVFAIGPIIGCKGYVLKLPLALTPVLHLRARGPKFWLGCLVLVTCLGSGFWAYYPADLSKALLVFPFSTVALTTLHPADDMVQEAKPDAPMPVDLYRFALNAFLVPLLDDAAPPKWTSAAVEFACGPGTTVMVDGEPMVVGQPIPVKAFTVRWMMDRCSPLGQDSVELSGGVELVVDRKGAGLSAVVKPDHLRIDSHMGRAWLRGPFTAETEMDTLAAKPQSKTNAAMSDGASARRLVGKTRVGGKHLAPMTNAHPV